MKMTTNERRPQIIKSEISQQPQISSSSNFKLKPRVPNQNGKLLEMKKTSNVRQPQKFKSGISQQTQTGSYLNINLKLKIKKKSN